LNTPNGYKNCDHITFLFKFDLAHITAMLWCGVPEDQVQGHLIHAKEIRSGIYDLEYMPCLKLRCQLIHTAIEQGNLSVCRENGIPVDAGDHVARARRHVRHKDLKEWMTLNFENDKPSFLFGEIECNALLAINNDAEHLSKELRILNEASLKFWGNADPEQKDTQPINEDVEKHLIVNGFSDNKAKVGASIIRPEWATKGRRITD
jgi:hypothetical protein